MASVCFTARYVAQTGSEIERKAWESWGYRREFYDINVSTPAAGSWRLWYWVKEQVAFTASGTSKHRSLANHA